MNRYDNPTGIMGKSHDGDFVAVEDLRARIEELMEIQVKFSPYPDASHDDLLRAQAYGDGQREGVNLMQDHLEELLDSLNDKPGQE